MTGGTFADESVGGNGRSANEGGAANATENGEANAGGGREVTRVGTDVAREPGDVDDLSRALAFLDVDVRRDRLVADGYRVGVVVGFGSAAVAALRLGPAAGLLVGLSVGLAAVHAIHRSPVWVAALHRTRALGAAPGLVGRLVLRMRLDPSPERAVRFAARTGTGSLAEALARHAHRSDDEPTTGLRAFVREWRPWFPSLDRAAALVRTAGAAPPERRERCLDRALDAVLSGTRDRLAAFVGDVQAPVSALYAFGVLLPLALIALLPAAVATGVPVSARGVAFGYLIVLPAGLLAAAAWLLSRRPVAFPPPTIRTDHPDVPRRWPLAAAAGGGCGVAAGLASGAIVAPWTAPVAGVGAGVGVALLVVARPRRRVLTEVRAVERNLPDAMTVVGGDVAEGVAVERAVEHAGERLDGATGEAFAAAARRSRTLRVGVREAFLGSGGPAATLPSARVRGTVELIGVAAREGRPAGDVLLELADQLESLRDLDRDARRQLATVTGTLTNTAAVFGPLVGGATVALATGIDASGGVAGGLSGADPVVGTDPHSSSTSAAPSATDSVASSEPAAGTAGFTVPLLGRIVGAYVLLLAVILTALATGLERGFDRTLVAYRVGIALPTATATYLVAFAGAGLLL